MKETTEFATETWLESQTAPSAFTPQYVPQSEELIVDPVKLSKSALVNPVGTSGGVFPLGYITTGVVVVVVVGGEIVVVVVGGATVVVVVGAIVVVVVGGAKVVVVVAGGATVVVVVGARVVVVVVGTGGTCIGANVVVVVGTGTGMGGRGGAGIGFGRCFRQSLLTYSTPYSCGLALTNC